jgi:cytochrome P450
MPTGPQSPDGGRARASALDLLKLAAALGADRLRGKRSDPAGAGSKWAQGIIQKQGGADLEIAVPGRPLELIAHHGHSHEVLTAPGGGEGYHPGKAKTTAMSFLAPGALTIAHGDSWRQLRPFNEQVLGTGHAHPFAQTFLGHVRAAFAKPVANIDEIRTAMGRAMVKIVLGDTPGVADPAKDVTVLFGVVQSPIKRKLLGFLYRGRKRRLYQLLARRWEGSASTKEQTLLAIAHEKAPGLDRDTLLQQIPHWMFTFTGSGTDLLARTLMLITSRPQVQKLVLDEIRAVGPASQADTVGRLAYIEACVLETGRLFPPVTKTFHSRSPTTGAKKQEVVHYFPLLHRDDRLGPTVHEFRPERWLSEKLDAAAEASNLFLRGPRACPGMDLILFVCKAAIARQLGELGVSARQDRLATDPLPVSFPKVDARFTVSERAT